MRRGPRVDLLGPIELSSVPRRMRLGGPISRLLLVRLAMNPGRVVSDEQLIDDVWGEDLPPSVETSLRVHVSTLRRAVDAIGWQIRRHQRGYVLDGESVGTDLDDLDHLEAQAKATTDPAAAAACLREALALWRGPALADVRRLAFGYRMGTTLDRRRSLLEDEVATKMVEACLWPDAVAWLQEAVQTEPLNERRWELLALSLHKSGRSAEALRAVNRAREVLADEVGLEPGPGLRTIEAQILADDTAAPTAAVASRPSRGVPKLLARRIAEAFVGRDRALADCTSRFDGVIGEQTSEVVRVIGESGIGKSSLLAAVATRAAVAGWRVVHGECDHDGTPFSGLDAIVRDLAKESPELHQTAASVFEAIGVADPVTALGDDLVVDDAQRRTRVLTAVRRLLTEAAADRPLLVTVDDVHPSDEITHAVLRSLVRTPLDAAVLLVVAERPDLTNRLGALDLPTVSLDRLGPSDVAEWIQRCDLHADATQVSELTAGLPYLLSVLRGRLRDGLSLEAASGAIGEDVLRDRCATLSRRAARLLAVAAVLGNEFSAEDLTNLTTDDTFEVLERLDEAAWDGVIESVEAGKDRFRFTHGLVRFALLDRLSTPRKQSLHARVVETITEDALGPVAAFNHALAAGGQVAETTTERLRERAARALIDGLAFEQARQLLGSASSAPTASLLAMRARCEAALGDANTARNLVDEALASASPDDPTTLVDLVAVRRLLGQRYVPTPGLPERLRDLHQALPADDRAQRVAVLRELAYELLNAGSLDAARAVIDEARAEAGPDASAPALASLLSLEHWLAESAGDRVNRRAAARGAIDIASSTTDPAVRAHALALQLIESLHNGDGTTAAQEAEALAALGREAGEPHAEWLGRAACFTPLFLDCRFDDAATASQRAFAWGSQVGVSGAWGAFSSQTFLLEWQHGDLTSFIEPLEGVVAREPSITWSAGLALALLHSGRDADAERQLEHAVSAVPEGHWLALIGAAMAVEVAAILDAPRVLEGLAHLFEQRIDDHILLGTGAADYGPARRYLGLIARGTGHQTEGDDLLGAVAEDPGSGEIWRIRAAEALTGKELP